MFSQRCLAGSLDNCADPCNVVDNRAYIKDLHVQCCMLFESSLFWSGRYKTQGASCSNVHRIKMVFVECSAKYGYSIAKTYMYIH